MSLHTFQLGPKIQRKKKMQCSVEEIAEKKRQALERLQRLKQCKQSDEVKPMTDGNNQATNSQIAEKKRQALERLKNRPRPNVDTAPLAVANQSTDAPIKPTIAFYGTTSSSKANELNDYENKFKHSADHAVLNRIMSQPYSARHSVGQAAEATRVASVFTTVVTCSCSMVSARRFEVKTVGYLEQLINVFKTIPSRSYGECCALAVIAASVRAYLQNTLFSSELLETETKTWTFGLEHYDMVQEKVGQLNPHVTIGKIPKFVVDLLKSGICLSIHHTEQSHFIRFVPYYFYR